MNKKQHYSGFHYKKLERLKECTSRYDKPFNIEWFISLSKISRTTNLSNMLFDLNTLKRTIAYAEDMKVNPYRPETVDLQEIQALISHCEIYISIVEERCRLARLIVTGKYTGKINRLKVYWYKLKDKLTPRDTILFG